MTLASAGEIDADLPVGENLVIQELRRDELARIGVVKLIIILGRAVVILVFDKRPEHGIDFIADPHNFVSALIAGIQ